MIQINSQKRKRLTDLENELIYKTDRPKDIENKLMVPKEERGRGIN